MCDHTISARDLASLTDTLTGLLHRVGSFEELEDWFRSQPCVGSVSTADHLIKTEPPRKEVSVTFEVDDGSTVTKVIDIILYPDCSLGVAGVHDP